MPAKHLTVNVLITSDETYEGLISQLNFHTSIPIDDLLCADGQYHYVPGSHRLMIYRTKDPDQTIPTDYYVAIINIYHHEDKKSASYLAMTQSVKTCPNCHSELLFYSYNRLHCRECGHETQL